MRAPDLDITTTPEHDADSKPNFNAMHCRVAFIHSTTFTPFLCNCSDISPWWRFMTCADGHFSRVSFHHWPCICIVSQATHIWRRVSEVGMAIHCHLGRRLGQRLDWLHGQCNAKFGTDLPSMSKVVVEAFTFTPPSIRFSYFDQWCSF